MNFIGAIVAGLVATIGMTMLMMVAPMMGMPKMDIMGMLGSMFSEDDKAIMTIGAVLHFMMGVVFGIMYALAWNLLPFANVGLLWGAIFGVVHALIVGMVAMPMMMKMHPRPPAQDSSPMAMVGMIMGHVVFGLLVAVIYPLF